MISSKLQARARRNHPLPRLSCEHVIAGGVVTAQIIRNGYMLNLCNQCWTKQNSLLITADGMVVEVRQ